MNQQALGLASKLLCKAQSTNFDAEAAALTERAYRLLADVLNDYDTQVAAATGSARKRERRHRRDRRAATRASRVSAASAASAANPRPDMPPPMATPPPAAPTSDRTAHARRAEWLDVPNRGSRVDLRV
jgi:hypothetical protein